MSNKQDITKKKYTNTIIANGYPYSFYGFGYTFNITVRSINLHLDRLMAGTLKKSKILTYLKNIDVVLYYKGVLIDLHKHDMI